MIRRKHSSMRHRCVWPVLLALGAVLALLGACYSQSQTLFEEGKRHYRSGNYQQAVTKFREAIDANPEETVSVRFYLLRAYDKLDRAEKVVEASREFLKASEEQAARWSEQRWEAMFLLEKRLDELGRELSEEDEKQKEINSRFDPGWSGETGGMRRD